MHKEGLQNSDFRTLFLNLFLHISRSLKICAQVESRTIVAGYSAVAPSPREQLQNTSVQLYTVKIEEGSPC